MHSKLEAHLKCGATPGILPPHLYHKRRTKCPSAPCCSLPKDPPKTVTEQTTCHPMCSDTRQPTQPRAIPTAENPAASGCTPDGNHTTVKGTLQKSKIVSPDLGQHRGGLLTTKGDVNSPMVGQRPCQGWQRKWTSGTTIPPHKATHPPSQ